MSSATAPKLFKPETFPSNRAIQSTGLTNGVQEPQDELVVHESQPARQAYSQIADVLTKFGDLYRDAGAQFGLVRVENEGVIHRIADASSLMALLIDRTASLIYVTSAGKPKSRIVDALLRDCLRTEVFLSRFPKLDFVTKSPCYLHDFSLTKPGYNDGGPHQRILYLPNGKPEASQLISRDTQYVDRFLDQMDFDDGASRTNLIAAALTVQLRHLWPGGKPVVLLTATQSHSGKDTCGRFAIGTVPYETISYTATNWAFEMSLTRVLRSHTNPGCVVVENARLDRREKQIASACLERILTEPFPNLFSSKGDSVKRINNIVFFISTNHGQVSEDLLNRSLHVHLKPRGDLTDRTSPIGNPLHEFLPKYRHQIAAELRGMIENWKEAGMPLDRDAKHPFALWAKTVGGILKFHNRGSFLANYGTRTTLDPIRESIAMLGAHMPDQWKRVGEWAELCHRLGFTRTILQTGFQAAPGGRAIGIGKLLSAYEKQTFVAETEECNMTLLLEKARPSASIPAADKRKVHYRFRVIGTSELRD